VTEIQIGRDCRKVKLMSVVANCWLRILLIDIEELGRVCYEWHIDNLKFETWANKLKEKIHGTDIHLAKPTRKYQQGMWNN
jgi:hypothetical protein